MRIATAYYVGMALRFPDIEIRDSAPSMSFSPAWPNLSGNRRERSVKRLSGESVSASPKPYDRMKDSGVEWLGQVPAHWEVERLKSVVRHVSEKADGPRESVPYIALEHVESWTGRVTPNYAETADSQLKRFESGDVLFGKLRPYLAKVVRANFRGQCVGEFLVLRATKNISEHFLKHLLRSKPTIDWVNSSTYGARMPRSDWQFVGSTKVAVPPLPEQTAIARFLDHATDRIDRYIRAKKQLIALLEEQKQVLIHDTVAGRIDVRTGNTYPAYKASGVEWLGKLPQHWHIRKLRQCVKTVGGMTPGMEEPIFWNGDIPWVTPKDMKKGVISQSSVTVSKAALDRTSLTVVEPPAVLMVVRGMILARRVPIARTSKRVTINQDMKALIPHPGTNAEFLARVLMAAQDALAALVDMAGHGTRRLPTERWRSLEVPLAPIDEQVAIAAFLRRAEARIDQAINNIGSQTAILRELRARLIADVVTGKLDVREAAAELPDISAIAWKDGADTIRAVSHCPKPEHGITAEANA